MSGRETSLLGSNDNEQKVSDAKRLKMDIESRVPKLNEDVMGIILDFVVAREQNRLIQATSKLWCNEDIDEMSIFDFHGFRRVALQSEAILYHEKDIRSTINSQVDRSVNWPEDLKTNSQRLVYHSNIKLLPNVILEVRPSCINETTNSRNFCFFPTIECFKLDLGVRPRWHDLRYELFTSKYRSMKDFECIWPIARHYGLILMRNCVNERCVPLVPDLFRLKILTGTYGPSPPR